MLASNDHLASLLSSGRRHSPRGADSPPLTEKAIVGAVSGIVAGRLLSGQVDGLPDLQPQLVEIVLMPYVGAGESARRHSGFPVGGAIATRRRCRARGLTLPLGPAARLFP